MRDHMQWMRGQSALLEEAAGPVRWYWAALLAVAVFVVNASCRWMDWANWALPGLSVDGHPILGTHDAYFWVASARGIGDGAVYLFAQVTAGLAGLLGIRLDTLAFWAPPVVGSLVGVVTFFWGKRLLGLWGGVAAGMVGSLAPGFYFRSRLGYYDTDLLTLLGPLAVALGLAALVGPWLRPTWLHEEAPADAPKLSPGMLAGALLLGLAQRCLGAVHADLKLFTLGLLACAVGVVLLAGRREQRWRGLWVLAVFCIAAYGFKWLNYNTIFLDFTVMALGGAALLAAAGWFVDRRGGPARPLALVMLAVALGLKVYQAARYVPPGYVLGKFAHYAKPVTEQSLSKATQGEAGPALPSVLQSIREASSIEWSNTFKRLAPHPWLAVPGIIGYLLLCLFRPQALVLLPLLLLSFTSFRMGARFSMFGGPAVALGLGFLVHWGLCALARNHVRRRWIVGGGQVAAGLLLVVVWLAQYRVLTPTPVLTMPHAEALIELGEKARAEGGDGMVWTWWDWGYATQYYTGMRTIADGGEHGGAELYPLAKVLYTDTPLQAAQMMEYAASRDFDTKALWEGMSAEQVRDFVASLAVQNQGWPTGGPQYLSVCWANIPLLHWIGYYGEWDPVAAGSRHPKMSNLDSPFRLDPRRGVLHIQGGGNIPLSGVIAGSMSKGRQYQPFFGNVGPRLLLNQDSRQAQLLDSRAYFSMAVQLLLGDPTAPEIAEHFRLVVDRFPHTRIYALR